MNAPHDPRFDELLPAYAIGALDGEDLRALESHLPGCGRCREALRGWQLETEALALAAGPVVPAETTRARLLRAIDADVARVAAPGPAVAGRGRLRSAGWWVAAAALALAVWAGAEQRALREQVIRLRGESAAVAARLDQVTSELDSTRGELARLRLASEILSTPDLRPVVLAGLSDAPAAVGHSFVNPGERRALFNAYKLPPAPAGKTYQLWFIADGKAVSAGTFDVDAQGHAQLVVESVAPPETIQAWAVTIEPAGGVPQPTGAMVLKG
jgi:anti-sigma-K factor RskA